MIKVLELGPFGCTIDHGTIQSLDQIPEGYTLKNITTFPESQTAIIEPSRPPRATHKPCEKTDPRPE